MSAIEEKRAIRRNIKALREANPHPDSSAVVSAVLALPQWCRARTVLLYSALPGEVDLGVLLAAPGKRVVLPLVDGDSLLLKLYEPGRLVPGYAGIMEPAADAPDVDIAEIDLALIPGVAFDAACNRLGRGRGYYDRLLARLGCPTLGVAFGWQMVDDVPTEEWDRPMDMLVVDGGLITHDHSIF